MRVASPDFASAMPFLASCCSCCVFSASSENWKWRLGLRSPVCCAWVSCTGWGASGLQMAPSASTHRSSINLGDTIYHTHASPILNARYSKFDPRHINYGNARRLRAFERSPFPRESFRNTYLYKWIGTSASCTSCTSVACTASVLSRHPLAAVTSFGNRFKEVAISNTA